MSSDTPSASSLLRPPRVLACVLCQKRKLKCDRKTPCANCIKSRAQCVLATLAQRQQRRRFPERALLEQLRKYENLLREHNVAFEPLHKDSAVKKECLHADRSCDLDDEYPKPEVSTPSTTTKSVRSYEPKNIWHVMNRGFRGPDDESDSSPDDVLETTVKDAWDRSVANDKQLLFGSQRTNFDLSTLRPDPAQVFRLWQIYLDNVNPLLKVTHIPSLQGRVTEAVNNPTSIDPNLEALLFGIYSMSVLSITLADCHSMFGSAKADLLMRFQYGCQQALWNCGFLQTSNRECLTALYLYLLSIRPSTLPQSLSSMLGVAVRIALRMGIHREPCLMRYTVVEAELRRRVWWSLVLFDNRIGELANSKSSMLEPTWDCGIPLNVNDSDLRIEMKKPPIIHGKSTDALFAVVRSEIGDFIRHTRFHLDFTSPVLKPLSKHLADNPASTECELAKLEKMLGDRYLESCDDECPVHCMTLWTTRVNLAKYRLLEHHHRYSSSPVRQSAAQRAMATSHALRMLECDTEIMTSPLTKGFLWFHHFHFPLPAYLQTLQDLRRRPLSEQTQQAWEVMSKNYEAWFRFRSGDGKDDREDSPSFLFFDRMVLQAWEACEAASKQLGKSSTPPGIVSDIRHRLANRMRNAQNADPEQLNIVMGMEKYEFSPAMPTDCDNQSSSFSVDMQENYALVEADLFSEIPGQVPFDTYMNQWGWNGMS